MINTKLLLGIVIITVCCVSVILCCDPSNPEQTQHGCRIDNGACTCSFGCKSEFRYANRKECQDALKGTSNDVCGRRPCLNGGGCTQISGPPGYKCRCSGTGYWGSRCQRQCPRTDDEQQYNTKFPHECVVI
ncbi:adhesive plaque matrix protein 2-like [Condylostylus longicornis]|uniref:adhesive plaque matrix protein 2-like n=1 Tax=Condylostylus longicornis TaxID=2530218 RepID=UPI00244DB90E|nr:adhesive plaque matrix protein 2-like [Condylostylus longicornis]